MPERFLLQILRSLVTHGILRSTRGVEGGYSLTRSVTEISLLEIVEAIEGPIHFEAQASPTLHHDGQGKLQQAFTQIAETARQQLHAIKLSDLLTA